VQATTSSDVGEGLDFETFYRRELPGLVRAMFLLEPDRDEAEEIAQEAMVRVYERWDRVRSMASPGGYVYRVALNLHRRRTRSLAVRARHVVALRARLRDAPGPDAHRELAEAIPSLSVRRRQAFLLVDWLGMTSEEAGRILGIAPASVRSRASRARSELRARLEVEDEEEG
jgi:RNA polymerase sigma factor (sigma-70 family)